MIKKQELKKLEELIESKALAAQREAIVSDDSLVVVSAGAGTGKTWTLALRFVWAVVTGRARVNEILTLTFTDKAATEMRERIGVQMSELLKEIRHLPEASSMLKDGLERLDESYISTIHSFASRVIRESGLTLDLDPAARLVSAPEEDLFWRQMTDSLDRVDSLWIGRNLSGEPWHWGKALMEDEITREVIDGYGPFGVITFARGLISLSASQGKRPDDLIEWADNLPERHEGITEQILNLMIPSWRREWHIWFGGEGEAGILNVVDLDGSTALASRLNNFQRDWLLEPEDDSMPDFLRALCTAIKGASGNLSKEIGLMTEERSVKDHRKNLLARSFLWDFAQSGWSQSEIEISSYLIKLAAICWLCWESRKKGRGLIAFDDMIVQASRALGENSSYSSRFKEVLVDEFQDTNGLQDHMIRNILQEGAGKLFLVGDLKQSIYRFRHADLQLFGGYIKKARAGGGRYIKLDVSFRTRDRLLDDVNRLYSSLWGAGLGQSLHHRYEELRPPVDAGWYRERQELDLPVSACILARKGEGREPIEHLRDRSANELAKYLLSLHEREATVWDKGKEIVRPIKWKDMAILAPARTQFSSIQRILGDRWGIPLHFEKNTGYYARTEVKDCIALLLFLSDQSDELSLAGYLCSPLSGIALSDAEDFLNSCSDEKVSLFQLLEQRFPQQYERLGKWIETGKLLGASAVVEELLVDGAILERFAEWKRRGVAANLRRTVDLLREYESTLGRGLSGCVRWLREALYNRAKEEEAGAVGVDEDVIRVMTVHASKGLEFPLVVLAGCDYLKSGRSSVITPSSHLGVALSRDFRDTEEMMGKSVHSLLEEQANLEEWQRLFYVGCTRARDCLILTGVDQYPDGSWLSMAPEFGEDLEVPDIPEREDHKSSIPEKGPAIERPDEPGGLSRISATSWAMFRYCPYGWRLRFRQGLDLSWEQRDGESGGGADMGSLAHWLLARWDFTPAGLDKLMARDETVLPNGLRNLWKDDNSRSNVRSWLCNLIASSEGKNLAELAASKILLREVPFRIKIEDGPLLVGAIDLMWREKGHIVIRDYKITAEGGAPEGLYENQLRFYGLVARRVMGDLPVDMGLWHLRGDCETERVTLSPVENWQDLKKQITVDAMSAAVGPWESKKTNCSTCPFNRRCHGAIKPHC